MASSRMFPLWAGLACFGRCRWSLAVAEELVSGTRRGLLAGAAGMARDRAGRPAAGGPGGRAGCEKLPDINLLYPAAEVAMIGSGGSRRAPWPGEPGRWPGLDLVAAPLRGRGTEVGMLGEVLDRVAGGRPAVVLIEGEAGIGKTRLLDA